MEKQDLIVLASNFTETAEANYIKKENAISDSVIGLKIFENPIFAFGDANDECFAKLKDPTIIGSHFMTPQEWLPEGKTVISFFLPFTEAIIKGNRQELEWPSQEWLHGRIEGQTVVNELCLYLMNELRRAGYLSIVPTLDKRFWGKEKPSEENPLSFTSNWSERHVAFVCGLGTFGLSKGLITSKGVAGRFGSIVTELPLNPDVRKYEGIYEYCSECGLCINQCPINAISFEKGKNHEMCCEFLDITKEKYKPRYGCGKCQVSVPCESCIPMRTV